MLEFFAIDEKYFTFEVRKKNSTSHQMGPEGFIFFLRLVIHVPTLIITNRFNYVLESVL